MPRTKVIYEDPSRLSQGLVIGLSVAIVAMAAWFAATVANTRTAVTAIEGDLDAAATPPPPPATSGSGAPVSDDASPQQTSVHFDWPKFATVPNTPPRQPQPTP